MVRAVTIASSALKITRLPTNRAYARFPRTSSAIRRRYPRPPSSISGETPTSSVYIATAAGNS